MMNFWPRYWTTNPRALENQEAMPLSSTARVSVDASTWRAACACTSTCGHARRGQGTVGGESEGEAETDSLGEVALGEGGS
jgi:hypothetical protein